MKGQNNMNYLLLFINIIMLVSGQVLWKIGVSKMHSQLSPKGIIEVIIDPYILGGGIIYVLATIIWLYLLSKSELSKIYPLQSLCYVFGAIAGMIIFKECFTLNKIFGLILILSGAVLIVSK